MSILTTKDNINFYIPRKKVFSPILIKKSYIDEVLKFSFNMTFGQDGEHRNHRSGGQYHRKKGEIFCDTLQGKLGEFFVYQNIKNTGLISNKPDTQTWNLGKWDDVDLLINGKNINIKSMAHFSNLLLLETRDWETDGTYTPNKKVYDYFVIVRIKPDLKSIFKKNRILYSNNIGMSEIQTIFSDIEFQGDIPGFITNKKLVEVIKGNQILPQGSMLNGKVKMDAENYYVISSDFDDFKNLIKNI